MKILTQKVNIIDGSQKKEFIIHKYKATEFIHVLRSLLSCLAHGDIQFENVMGFAPSVIEAYINLKLQTGVNSDNKDLEKLQESINLNLTETLFNIFKLALKSLNKESTDELIGYFAYAVSVDEINRLTNAENSVYNIDNFIDSPSGLILLFKEVLFFNFKDFFLGFQQNDIQ